MLCFRFFATPFRLELEEVKKKKREKQISSLKRLRKKEIEFYSIRCKKAELKKKVKQMIAETFEQKETPLNMHRDLSTPLLV